MPSSVSPFSFLLRKPSRATVDYLALESHYSTSPNAVVPLIPSSPSNTCMSLLDKYEIERISKELNHYIETSQAEYYEGFIGHNRAVSFPGNSTASEKKSHEQRVKRSKGWFRHGMMCSSRHDIVVENRVLGNPQLPDKHAPLAEKHISFIETEKRSGMIRPK